MNSEIPPKIAEPCPKLWKDMKGDAKQRFCDHCNLHVHNLSEMTTSERKNLLTSDKRICVAYEADANGALLTRESVPWFSVFFTRLRWGFVTILASMASFGLSSCGVRQILGATGRPAPPSKSPADHSTSRKASSENFLLGRIPPPSGVKSDETKKSGMIVGGISELTKGAADAQKDFSQGRVRFMQAGTAGLYTPGVNSEDKRFANIPRETLPSGCTNPQAAEWIKYAEQYNTAMVSYILSSKH